MQILSIFLAVAAVVAQCFTATTMWNWFAAPLLGVPVITALQSLGLSYVVAAFRGIYVSNTDLSLSPAERQELYLARLGVSVLYSISILVMGAILHAFMN